MNRRWICSDVWMDILPSFDHAQLGLKMALISDRFDVLVDTHFGGKSELTIWKTIKIWHIFTTSIRHLRFSDANDLDNLRRRTSPTVLTDLCQLHSIDSYYLFPDGIADDGPNATAGQALSKWLQTPTKNGQPKRSFLQYVDADGNLDWVNSFKETFRRATASSVSYKIYFEVLLSSFPKVFWKKRAEKIDVGEDEDESLGVWLLKRCPISEKAATDQWENDENWDKYLNTVHFILWDVGINFIGPLSRPADEEEKEACQSNNEMFSTTPGPSGLAE